MTDNPALNKYQSRGPVDAPSQTFKPVTTGDTSLWQANGAGQLNTSGIDPLDLKVIVLPDPVQEKVGSIILADSTKERDKFAMVKGTLIAAGENAWEEAAGRSPKFTMPQPGERVMIAKYGGLLFTGADGKEYRIMNDTDVIGRVLETAK